MSERAHLPAQPPVLARRRSAVRDERSHVESGRGAWTIIGTSCFLMMCFYIGYLQSEQYELAIFRGAFVPDSVNMAQTLDDIYSLQGVLPFDKSFIGVSLIYGWTWLVHPGLAMIINASLIILSALLLQYRVGPAVNAPGWGILGLFLNPYIILVSTGPNKEIPLIFLTLLWLSTVIRRNLGWPIWAFLISLAIITFRDGYGAAFLIATTLILVFGYRARMIASSYFSITLFISAVFGILASVFPILERNLAGYRENFDQGQAVGNLAASAGLDPLTAAGGMILFILRLIYNAMVMALFPVFETEYGHNYWLGVSYWVFGLTFLLAFVASLSALARLPTSANRRVQFLACVVAIVWFTVSVSQFVQPRYLMPILPAAFLVFAVTPKPLRTKLAAGALIIVGATTFLYSFVGRSPPPAEVDIDAPPAFLWNGGLS